MEQSQFRSPTAEFRPVAMWFLNGDLDAAEVQRQVAAMAAGGIGGVQVAARTGLETPYLSERWFALIRLILAESHRHGLAVWLADEYPYPSGASGGEVILRHPEYRAWRMQARRVHARAGEEVRVEHPGTVALRTVAVPLADGVARWPDAIDLGDEVGLWQREQVLFQPSQVYLTTRRYMTNAPRPTLTWRASRQAADWDIWLIAAAELTDYKFFGAYVDLCNPDAGQLFLDTTYERYLERLGPAQFGQLAGFFLDEAHPQNWSWRLPEYFLQRNGYDLHEVLPGLWTDIGPRTSRIRYDYWQSITELFVDSFHKPVAEWCRTHGVQLSLEVPSTRNIVQRHADVPGIDPGHDKVGVSLDDILARELTNYRGNLTFPASLAAQTGRPRVLDELFHSVGWSLTLQDMKAMLDRAAARGANLFAFHAFCYTIGGLRKWDAPPSEFEQNPYWPHFPLLSAYAGRLSYAMSRGRRVAPVAVLDPVSTLWSHQDAAGVRDDVGHGVVADWGEVLRALTTAQRPHDTIDPLLLAEARMAEGALCLGDARYSVVVVPRIASLERAAWLKLEELAAGGGTVVACGQLHSEDIESGEVIPWWAAAVARSAGGFVQLSSPGELVGLLDEIRPPDLRIMVDDAARRDFLLAQRRAGDQDLYFIANSGMAEHSGEVTVKLRDASNATVTRIDLENGEAQRLTVVPDADSTRARVRLHFQPYGAHLLVVGPTSSAAPIASRALEGVDVPLEGQWRCEPADDNVLRLDRFSFTLGSARTDAPVIEPKPLINIFQDLASSGRSWPGDLRAAPMFGAPPRLELQLPVLARYTAQFDVEYMPSRAVVCIEDAALVGTWTMWLNETPIGIEDFVRKRRWDVGNRAADVLQLLKPGTNEVRVEVRATEPWGGLVDALYVLGDFAVYLNASGLPSLRQPPPDLRWADRHTHGYPYYAGTLHLTRRIFLPVTGAPVRLRLPDKELMFAGIAHLSVNGRPLGVRAWAPYAWDMPDGLPPGGETEITLSITNTLVEQLEGKRYNPHTRSVEPLV